MVPKSHFQQVLPDNFVDAAFSFTALHWLQHKPNYDAATRDRPGVADSARDDLVAFLSARHQELRHGSTLLLCIPGQGPISPSSSLECLDIVIRELSPKYHLSPSVIDRLPMYWRTMGEILSAVSASDGAWDVLGHETVPMVHPAWPDPSNKRSSGTTEADDNETYATAVVGFGMAALSGFLVEDARSNADSQYPGDAKFLEDFRSVFRREFLRSYCHEKVGFTYAFVHLQKV